MATETGYGTMPNHPADALVFAEWLFTHTIDDLGERIEADPADRYKLLGIAPLLRKLIIDGESVLTKVCTGRRRVHGGAGTRPRYAIAPYEPKPDTSDAKSGGRWKLVLSLGGADIWGGSKVTVNHDRLLKVPVGQTEEGPITVDQLVRYYSHVEGGVHFENTVNNPSAAETYLFMIAKIQVGAPLQHIETLRSIGRVVHAGLLPLRKAIEQRPTPASPRRSATGQLQS